MKNSNDNNKKSERKDSEITRPDDNLDYAPGAPLEEADDAPLKEGEDAVEMSVYEGEKIVYGTSFSPQDGDIGDESEDLGDLTSDLSANRYDPTLSTGGRIPDQSAAIPEGIHLATEDQIGMAYNEDRYTDADDSDDNIDEGFTGSVSDESDSDENK